jgi:hypothetical protein
MTSPGSVQLSQLARDLYRMGPAGRRRLAKAFRDAGQPLEADAKSRASWSSRIPAAIKVSPMTGAGDRVGVQLRVSTANAPHARPYEGMGQGGSFRHPVFGRDRWVSQATRPYAWPAVKAAGDRIQPAIAAAYEDAARECGFR